MKDLPVRNERMNTGKCKIFFKSERKVTKDKRKKKVCRNVGRLRKKNVIYKRKNRVIRKLIFKKRK